MNAQCVNIMLRRMSLVILVRSRASRRTPEGRLWIRDIQGNVRDVEFLRWALRKPRRQRQREHHQTKRLTSRVYYVPL